jgi:hypothetical protein
MQLAISSPVALPSRLRGRCVRRGLDSRVSMVTRPRGSGIHPESTGAAAQILQASSPSGFSWAWPAARALSSRRAALANQGRTRDRTENFSPLHSRWRSAWDWRAWKAGTVLATSRTQMFEVVPLWNLQQLHWASGSEVLATTIAERQNCLSCVCL